MARQRMMKLEKTPKCKQAIVKKTSELDDIKIQPSSSSDVAQATRRNPREVSVKGKEDDSKDAFNTSRITLREGDDGAFHAEAEIKQEDMAKAAAAAGLHLIPGTHLHQALCNIVNNQGHKLA
ncbi:hypothetical protein MBANPS3_009693 [Mucor bainieri]